MNFLIIFVSNGKFIRIINEKRNRIQMIFLNKITRVFIESARQSNYFSFKLWGRKGDFVRIFPKWLLMITSDKVTWTISRDFSSIHHVIHYDSTIFLSNFHSNFKIQKKNMEMRIETRFNFSLHLKSDVICHALFSFSTSLFSSCLSHFQGKFIRSVTHHRS